MGHYLWMMRHCHRSMDVLPWWRLNFLNETLGFSLIWHGTFDDVTPFGGFEEPWRWNVATLEDNVSLLGPCFHHLGVIHPPFEPHVWDLSTILWDDLTLEHLYVILEASLGVLETYPICIMDCLCSFSLSLGFMRDKGIILCFEGLYCVRRVLDLSCK